MGGDDAGHGFGGLLHVIEHGHQGLGGLRRGRQLAHGLGDDAQGAFGLQHHAGQVVTGDAFDGAGTALDQLAGGVKEFQAHQVVLGDAVLQATQTTGVFGDVTGQGGHGLGTRIRGIEQVLLGNLGSKSGRDHAGFHHGVQVVGVDLKDAVQAVGQDDHAFLAVRDGAAGQVGTGTAHGHGNAVVIEFFHTDAELLGGGGTQRKGGHHGGQHRGIIGITLAVSFGAEHVFLAEEIFKFFDKRLACHKGLLLLMKYAHQPGLPTGPAPNLPGTRKKEHAARPAPKNRLIRAE